MEAEKIRQIEIEMAGRKVLERLRTIKGCEAMAWNAAQQAARRAASESTSFGPDDDWGLDQAAKQLESANPALFIKPVGQMTASEREADLKRQGIL